jgi:alpha-glucosidase
LKFLERVRALMDKYPGTAAVGEVGDAHHALEIMGAYTAGRHRLHMCYSFDMLGPRYTPRHFRTRVERFLAAAKDGWPCWSFSNHDVTRHVTRWAKYGPDPEAVARQSLALLLSLKGSVCLYQGEELGLPQSELEFHELTDPAGIRFWPDVKGRDGCRTPIPWTDGPAPNGFTTGTPWLPIKPPQGERNVEAEEQFPDSVLAFYRQALAFRRANTVLIDGDIEFLDASGDILAFTRSGSKGSGMFCVFNLSPDSGELQLSGLADEASPVLERGVSVLDSILKLAPGAFGFFELQAGDVPAISVSGRTVRAA